MNEEKSNVDNEETESTEKDDIESAKTDENPQSFEKPPEYCDENESEQGFYEEDKLSQDKSEIPIKVSGRASLVVMTATICFFCSMIAAVIGLLIGLKLTNSSLTFDGVVRRVKANSEQTIIDGTIAQVTAAANDSVVTLYGSYDDISVSGVASGVAVFREDGFTYIVCSAHAVEQFPFRRIKTTDGTYYAATLVGIDTMSDIALLRVETSNLRIAIPSFSPATLGETVIAIGNPLSSLGNCTAFGIVSNTECTLSISGVTMSVIKIDAALNPGNSGGGVFDMNGCLVGIVAAKITAIDDVKIEGAGFAIPTGEVYRVISELKSKGYVSGRQDIGITFTYPQSPSQLPTIESFNPLDASDVGKLLAGDTILRISTPNLKTGDMSVGGALSYTQAMTNYRSILSQLSDGDIVYVTYKRAGSLVDTVALTVRIKN